MHLKLLAILSLKSGGDGNGATEADLVGWKSLAPDLHVRRRLCDGRWSTSLVATSSFVSYFRVWAGLFRITAAHPLCGAAQENTGQTSVVTTLPGRVTAPGGLPTFAVETIETSPVLPGTSEHCLTPIRELKGGLL